MPPRPVRKRRNIGRRRNSQWSRHAQTAFTRYLTETRDPYPIIEAVEDAVSYYSSQFFVPDMWRKDLAQHLRLTVIKAALSFEMSARSPEALTKEFAPYLGAALSTGVRYFMLTAVPTVVVPRDAYFEALKIRDEISPDATIDELRLRYKIRSSAAMYLVLGNEGEPYSEYEANEEEQWCYETPGWYGRDDRPG